MGKLIRLPLLTGDEPDEKEDRRRNIRGPLTAEEYIAAKTLSYPDGAVRPKTRGECVGGPRPCPWVSCRHHLYLEVHESGIDSAYIRLNRPELQPEDMTESCSLDVADRTESTLEQTGQILGLTRERIRQLESRAVPKVRRRILDLLRLTKWNA